jgi:hypothetical protein
VPDLVKLLDAAGRLVDDGSGPGIHGLHETHQRMLHRARDHWHAKNGQMPDEGDADR